MQAGALSRLGSAALALSLIVTQTGCVSMQPRSGAGASTGSKGSLTPAERKMREDSAKLDVKSSIQGCLAGAAAGALVGLLAGGGRSRDIVIGTVGGCVVGVGANAYIQSKRKQYYSNEERIQSEIADVRADNERLARLVSSSKKVMAADRRKIASLEKAYRNKSMSLEQARREMDAVKANRDHLENTVGSLKKKEKDWQEISEAERNSGANTAGLDAEIRKLRKKVNRLEKEVALMDQEIVTSPIAG